VLESNAYYHAKVTATFQQRSRAEIKAAIGRARAHPVHWDLVKCSVTERVHRQKLRLAPHLPSNTVELLMSSHKFKVGDSVTVRKGPFNLYEVTKQLPRSGDQLRYYIGMGLSNS
jgi:hypothetical protein